VERLPRSTPLGRRKPWRRSENCGSVFASYDGIGSPSITASGGLVSCRLGLSRYRPGRRPRRSIWQPNTPAASPRSTCAVQGLPKGGPPGSWWCGSPGCAPNPLSRELHPSWPSGAVPEQQPADQRSAGDEDHRRRKLGCDQPGVRRGRQPPPPGQPAPQVRTTGSAHPRSLTNGTGARPPDGRLCHSWPPRDGTRSVPCMRPGDPTSSARPYATPSHGGHGRPPGFSRPMSQIRWHESVPDRLAHGNWHTARTDWRSHASS
jgi:hypothetical protein